MVLYRPQQQRQALYVVVVHPPLSSADLSSEYNCGFQLYNYHCSGYNCKNVANGLLGAETNVMIQTTTTTSIVPTVCPTFTRKCNIIDRASDNHDGSKQQHHHNNNSKYPFRTIPDISLTFRSDHLNHDCMPPISYAFWRILMWDLDYHYSRAFKHNHLSHDSGSIQQHDFVQC
jgi:hypothetical protein